MVRSHRVLVASCLALATVVSAVASLNVALPEVARDTGASQTELAWIVDAYALVFAALLLPAGALGDRFGRRTALVTGLLVFSGAAGVAMLVDSPGWLIACRCGLGLGAALVMPATLSTITSTFEAEARVRGIAIWSGIAGASAILGLLLSGAVLEFWSWPAVFGLSLVLALVSLACVVATVPESSDRQSASNDPVGAILSVAGLAAVVYGIIEAPQRGWSSTEVVLCLIGGLAVLAVFIWWELRIDNVRPLLDPRLFAKPTFAMGSLSLAVQFFCFFGFIFAFLQYLQFVRGDSPWMAAVSMLPLPLGLMPASRISPKLLPRLGQAALCGAGLTLLAGSLASLAVIETDTPYWTIGVAMWVMGLGMGLAMPPATTAITESLPPAEQGVASAVNDLARELGGALGIAILGTVLNSEYRSSLVIAAAPAEVVDRVRESIAAAAVLGPDGLRAAGMAFTEGVNAALLVAAIVAVAGAIIVTCTLIPAGRPHTNNSHGEAPASAGQALARARQEGS